MAISLRDVRSGAIIVLLLGIPLMLLRSTLQDPHHMNGFDRAVHRIGAPLEAGVTYSARWVGSFFERWIFQASMLDDKLRLEEENREHKRELVELAQLREENRQLRRALQMRDQVPEDLLSAAVTGREHSPFFRVVKIDVDRGDDYVRPGMAVLAPDGVVGRINRTHADHSDVMLITDPASKIAVEVARTRCPGILEGLGEDQCRVRIISCDEPVVEGDVIQTSGVDDLFPKGHPVGRVVSVERKVNAQLVDVIPSIRFDRLDMVWVVLANAPEADPRAGQPRARQPARGLSPLH
ncbi:rod shape-determining protein MreC [Plesiocystis pacifica SIR-1]|uniref:Cell shape-determining protein MreC n=1 Tax=Plesiocystis pacifica SIR-1 TaxID=391625 RepID=A6GK30_9BACT|nr:rod shape-determining protein MreC [Plesiocystis pacifica]EDM73774.1 rod shape-determining protein MreC [Plesiocystis pacifica SIR-1]